MFWGFLDLIQHESIHRCSVNCISFIICKKSRRGDMRDMRREEADELQRLTARLIPGCHNVMFCVSYAAGPPAYLIDCLLNPSPDQKQSSHTFKTWSRHYYTYPTILSNFLGDSSLFSPLSVSFHGQNSPDLHIFWHCTACRLLYCHKSSSSVTRMQTEEWRREKHFWHLDDHHDFSVGFRCYTNINDHRTADKWVVFNIKMMLQYTCWPPDPCLGFKIVWQVFYLLCPQNLRQVFCQCEEWVSLCSLDHHQLHITFTKDTSSFVQILQCRVTLYWCHNFHGPITS